MGIELVEGICRWARSIYLGYQRIPFDHTPCGQWSKFCLLCGGNISDSKNNSFIILIFIGNGDILLTLGFIKLPEIVKPLG